MAVTVNGFIRLHRKIVDWEWYQNPNTFRVFLHCLLKANFSDGRFEGKEVKRGEFVTSLDHLAAETRLSIKQVRVSLEHLIVTGELASRSYNRFRIITVVKYDEYQSDGKQEGSQTASKGQAEGKQGASKGQQYNNNNNNNKGIREEIKTPLESTPPDGFDQFWSAYPRHVGKAEAKKQFDKLKPDVELLGKMLDAIERQKASSQWQRDDGQYIPYPATWLNKKRWEDEVEQTTAPVRRQTGGMAPAQKYEQRSYVSEQDEAVDRMMNSDWGSW